MKRFLIVLAVLVVCAPSALAGESMSPEQLAGEWSYAQKAGNDVYVDMLVIKMGPDGPAGIMHYRDGDQEKQDVFSHFVVQKTGRIDFISKRPDGKVARHRGYPSNGGNTIRGKYDLGFGVGGAFVLNRSGVDGPAVLSGRWTYHIIDPSGGPGEYGDMLLLGDVGGIRGVSALPHNRDVSEKVRGSGFPGQCRQLHHL